MSIITKYNTASLAKSLQPGIESLIGGELDSLINEAVEASMFHVRNELVEKCTISIKQNIQRVMFDERIDVNIDLTIGGGKDET